MNTLVVASLQMGMNMPLTRKEFRTAFERYLKVAVAKNCDLVVGSELGAAMIALPFIERRHREALLNVRKSQSARAGLLTRIRGSAERLNPRWSAADTRKLMLQALQAQKQSIWEFYDATFSALAAQYRIVLVAPSAWLADPLDGQIRNISCVYDVDGRRAGYQAKVVLAQHEHTLARPGTQWKPVETDVGTLGVALGFDGLMPETGRLFAMQRASLLVHPIACTTDMEWGRAHRATVLRCLENQLFGCVSCLVGPDRLLLDDHLLYRGRSMFLAPLEVSPQKNGVLIAMENEKQRGLVVSTLDYNALQDTWKESHPGFRAEFSRVWDIYVRSQAIEEDPKRILTEQSLAEDMMPEEGVTVVEAQYTDDPVPAPPAAMDSEDSHGKNPDSSEDQDESEDVLHMAATLDDLDVVAVRVLPWPVADTEAPDKPPLHQAYNLRGDREETREMDTLYKDL